MKNLGAIDWLALVLVIVGGLNWLLVGLFDWNLVTALFGTGTLTNIVYDLVGVSALWMVAVATKLGKK